MIDMKVQEDSQVEKAVIHMKGAVYGRIHVV